MTSTATAALPFDDADGPDDAGDRLLATVDTVASLHEIADAENIVRARVRGWDVVVKRGEFTPGDPCVYFEVDSLLPTADPRFAFLAPRGERTDPDGRTGHVLKTAKLRGVYSQGLVLPLSEVPEAEGLTAGADLTAALGIVKWDPPLPAELVGRVRGRRPAWLPATREDRVQNLAAILASDPDGWKATEKIDGESCSIWADGEGNFGVTTREIDLLDGPDSPMWNLAREHRLHERLAETFPGVRSAVQGEAHGSGFKKDPLRLGRRAFAAFTLRVDGQEVPRDGWPQWLLDIAVPTFDLPFPSTVDEALAQVDGLKSKVNPARAAEGVVWRKDGTTTVALADGRVVRASCKVIGQRYAAKNDR